MRVQNRKEQFGVLVEEVRAEEEIPLKKVGYFLLIQWTSIFMFEYLCPFFKLLILFLRL